MEYCDVHRAFLQAISNNGSLNKIKAFTLFSQIWKKFQNFGDDDDEESENCETSVASNEDFENAIKLINDKIFEFDQKIVQIIYEPLQETYIVFVNTSETTINKFQNIYSESDLDYFRKLIKEIALNEEKFLGPIVCINLCSKSITKSRGEELIEEWCNNGYFHKIDDKIYFGPKLVVEFANYLKSNFPDDTNSCCLCSNMVYMGVKCNDCHEELHLNCIQKYLTRVETCPSCKTTWNTWKLDKN